MKIHPSLLLLSVLFFCPPPCCAAQSKTNPPKSQSEKAPVRVSPGQPAGGPSHFEKAETYLKDGKFVDAIAEYRKSLEDYPDNEAAYFGMALAQTQAGLAEEAVLSYESALKINPRLWEAETNLGMLLMTQQTFDPALVHFQKAQELNPKNFQSAFFVAKAFESLGRWKDAAEAGLKALPLAEDSVSKFEVHASLGAVFLKAGDFEAARKHLSAAREYGQDSAVDVELARLHFQTGEYGKCAELLEPLSKQHPESASIQEMLGRVWMKQESYEAAISALEKALKQQTDAQTRQDIALELAQAFQKLNQPDKAIALLQTVAAQSADSSLHFSLATVYLQQRMLSPAAQSFLRALQLKPDCVECYSNLGSVFMLQES